MQLPVVQVIYTEKIVWRETPQVTGEEALFFA